MEKHDSVDQTRLARVQTLLDALPAVFRRQGTVVATWRTITTSEGDQRRHGPYWSLRYRDGGRQCSHYLGRCSALAAAVRRLLAKLQRRRRRILLIERVRAAAKAAQRAHKKIWEQHIRRELGACLKGYELRGWKNASRTRTSKLAAVPPSCPTMIGAP